MANREQGYGLSAEADAKLAAKYNVEKEHEARVWMEEIVGEQLVPGASEPLGADRFHEVLKDGTFLCKVASKVTGAEVKHNTSKSAFKLMENINNFITACESYGVAKTDLFQTVDLYENQNMWQVVCCIHALGRKAQTKGFDGPVLGPREASKNERTFTEDQIKSGESVLPMQAGTNQGATQAGMSFGGRRHINDMKVEEMSEEGKKVISLQSGTSEGANASGQNFGKSRGIIAPNK